MKLKHPVFILVKKKKCHFSPQCVVQGHSGGKKPKKRKKSKSAIRQSSGKEIRKFPKSEQDEVIT